MPERLAADKKQKIDSAHADLLAALHARAVSLTEDETHHLREKLAAYIEKTNPEEVDIPRLADEITEKIRNPRTRARWFAPDKTEKTQRTHADLVTALQARAVNLTDDEMNRLHKKLTAYIGKINPEHIDIPTLADAVAEKIGGSSQARVQWFKKVGILGYAFENIDAKIEGLRERGFDNPIKIITTLPSILGLAFENIDAKIEGLRERGFENPVKLITSSPSMLVFCFAERAHAEQFRERFGGEFIAPKDRPKWPGSRARTQ